MPLAREVARFSAVRSFTNSRSYSAREPRTPIIVRPAAVDESMPSVVDQGHSPVGKRLDGLQNVEHVAAPPVEPPGCQGVSLPQILQGFGDAITCCCSASSRPRHPR